MFEMSNGALAYFWLNTWSVTISWYGDTKVENPVKSVNKARKSTYSETERIF